MDATPDTFWSLFGGYAALWILIFALVLRLVSEQKRTAAKVSELEAKVRTSRT